MAWAPGKGVLMAPESTSQHLRAPQHLSLLRHVDLRHDLLLDDPVGVREQVLVALHGRRTRGVLKVTVITSPGCSGLGLRNVSPITGLPALSYQFSSTLRPAMGAASMFLSRKVVTISLADTFVAGLVISTFALPRTGATSFLCDRHSAGQAHRHRHRHDAQTLLHGRSLQAGAPGGDTPADRCRCSTTAPIVEPASARRQFELDRLECRVELRVWSRCQGGRYGRRRDSRPRDGPAALGWSS